MIAVELSDVQLDELSKQIRSEAIRAVTAALTHIDHPTSNSKTVVKLQFKRVDAIRRFAAQVFLNEYGRGNFFGIDWAAFYEAEEMYAAWDGRCYDPNVAGLKSCYERLRVNLSGIVE